MSHRLAHAPSRGSLLAVVLTALVLLLTTSLPALAASPSSDEMSVKGCTRTTWNSLDSQGTRAGTGDVVTWMSANCAKAEVTMYFRDSQYTIRSCRKLSYSSAGAFLSRTDTQCRGVPGTFIYSRHKIWNTSGASKACRLYVNGDQTCS